MPEDGLQDVLDRCVDFFSAEGVMGADQSQCSIYLVFVEKLKMQELNLQFRNMDKPTDVLSFAPSEPEFLGELVFCIDVLKLQAMENNHSIRNEFIYLLIHGLLHLLGYDHENDDDQAKEMLELQDNLFEIVRE
ncbi:MAG: rRNA maturation RNase YbeY [Bdellovibrionaceae bacterium]|nr:rRNA maturation RNase YbeY [Pseudobdellovibrionaceae bacterium]